MDSNPPSPNPIPQRISSVNQRIHASPTKPSKRAKRSLSSDIRPPHGSTTHFDHDLSTMGLPTTTTTSTAANGTTPAADHSDCSSIGEDFIYNKNRAWSSEKERVLLGPYDYLDSHPGKDIRSQLIAAFNVWLQVPPERLAIINKVVGMLHTASLLIDDVEDSSLLRRGVPVAHSIFGTAQTINSANYVYFLALSHLQSLRNPRVISIFTSELLNLHRGQGMDLYWRDTLTTPSEDDYLEMVDHKTGGLFRLAVKLMSAESPQPLPTILPLTNTIGLLFQILDDYRNLSHPTYTQNKGLAEDLTEGKFSFPVIHAVRADAAANRAPLVLNVLRQKPTDDAVKSYAVRHMDEVTGSFAYTRAVLRGLERRALALVAAVEGEAGIGAGTGDGVRAILEALRVKGFEHEEEEGEGEMVVVLAKGEKNVGGSVGEELVVGPPL